MARNIDPEILLGFVLEAQGYLAPLRQELQAHASTPGALGEAYRLAHTIKGAASMVGLSVLSHVAHHLESAVEELMNGTLVPAVEPVPILLQEVELIEALLATAEQEDAEESLYLEEATRLDGLLRGSAVAPSSVDEPPGPPAEEEEEVSAELREVFQLEAAEHLQTITLLLPKLEHQPDDRESIQEIRRSAHTLKGAAAMVGFRTITQLAHRMEDALDRLYEGSLTLTPETFQLLAAAVDALEDLAAGKQAELTGMYECFDELLSQSPAVASPPEVPVFQAPPLPMIAKPRSLPVAVEASEPTVGVDAEADISAELREVFLLEAAEHLRTIATTLPRLEQTPDDKEALQEIRRSAHTLKGAAAMVGLRAVTQLAHRMEDALDLLYDDGLTLTPDTFQLLGSATDALEDLAAGKTVALAPLLQRFESLTSQKPAETPSEAVEEQPAANEQAAPVFTERRVRFGESLEAIVKLVSEQVIGRTAFEQRMADFLRMITELQPSTERLRRVAYRLETEYEASALGAGPAAPRNRLAHLFGGHGFDELEFDRYSEFHLLTRELAETANDVQTLTGELGHLLGDFDSYLTQQARLTSDIEEKLMRLRMIPLSTLASRFHRTVRQVSQELDKKVDLVLEGENTGLDKSVLEEMAEPLLHLLRNAVDHGIERPEARAARNKPARGRIVLRAAHEGSQVVIRLQDDGAGLSVDAIRATAIDKGFVTASEASNLGEQELFSLIFQPGFSTARTVSEISGRGVGMDVVKTRVTRLKGTVSLDSRPGAGTTITIRLPLTLAITRALMVQSNQETFAIPLPDVRQILRIDRDEINQVGDSPTLRIAGRVYPVIHLAQALGLKQPADESVARPPVLLLQAGEREVALVVDHLLGGREIVVKNLGSHLKRVPGITGATLAGDGNVVLILNPAELVRQTNRTRAASSPVPARNRQAKGEHEWTILIVDDSPSVRRVISNLVERVGWKAVTAKNGIEALEVLQRSATAPDFILLDVEMPRMDGYDFLATVRANEAYRHLPIAMLTSRAGEKHRRKALDLGATDYLVKPYEDEQLLATIRRLVREGSQVPV